MRKAYRLLFGGAAVYNLAFGVWAGFFPNSFFTLFNLKQPEYPSIWACLGMVVGTYAIAYAHVAWKPQQGDLLIGIGLLGKALGPFGWIVNVWQQGELPPRTFPLILANDLIWWFPFLLYLLRRWPNRRMVVAWLCVTLHVLACVLLLASSRGTTAEPDLALRQQWIDTQEPLWVTTWFVWALGSMSLIAFCAVWTARLLELKAARMPAIAGFLIIAAGLPFDLSGEVLNIVWPTQTGRTFPDFAWGVRAYDLLGAGVANGLYCVGGLILSVQAWRVGLPDGWLGVLGIMMWTIGLALTAMAILDQRIGMIATGAGVMALFIPWAALVGWRLCEEGARET